MRRCPQAKRGVKKLTRLSQVYSPHTAVDAAPGGLGDWLADIVTGKTVDASQEDAQSAKEDGQPAESKAAAAGWKGQDPFVDDKAQAAYMVQHHPARSALRDPDLQL